MGKQFHFISYARVEEKEILEPYCKADELPVNFPLLLKQTSFLQPMDGGLLSVQIFQMCSNYVTVSTINNLS